MADLSGLSDEALLEELAATADRIDAVNAEQEALWARRLAIYQAARDREPPITQQALASAARVSEVAVIQTLKKAAKKAETAAAGAPG